MLVTYMYQLERAHIIIWYASWQDRGFGELGNSSKWVWVGKVIFSMSYKGTM